MSDPIINAARSLEYLRVVQLCLANARMNSRKCKNKGAVEFWRQRSTQYTQAVLGALDDYWDAQRLLHNHVMIQIAVEIRNHPLYREDWNKPEPPYSARA